MINLEMHEENKKINELLNKEIDSASVLIKTIEKYEHILITKWQKDLDIKAKKEKDNMLIHSKFAMKIALEIAIEFEMELDLNLLASSAFLHDISKHEEKQNEEDETKKHNVLGANYILSKENNLDLNGINSIDIATIIKSHRGQMEEIDDSVVMLSARIVRDADKISKMYKSKNWTNDKDNKEKAIENIMEKIDKKVDRKEFLDESKIIYKRHMKKVKLFLEHNL